MRAWVVALVLAVAAAPAAEAQEVSTTLDSAGRLEVIDRDLARRSGEQ